MIAVDLSNDVIIPSGVAIVGALVAGISAVLKSWFENKDARSRGDRKLDLAKRRTEFAKDWIAISKELEGADTGDALVAPGDPTPESKAGLIERAREELREAARETEIAFYDATTDTSTGLLQLRRLLMLVRRRSLASYVVSGLFLFTSVFAWLLVCIPTPGNDGFSIPAAIFVSIVATFVLRVLAGLTVSGLERHAIPDSETITDLTVKDNLVTVTTKAEHAFGAGQTVMIDASDDRFDGTFEEIGIPDNEHDPDRTKFTFKLRSADAHSLPGVTGWVCGDSVKKQMQRLFMIERFTKLNDDRPSTRRRRGARLASILFLVSIVAISTGVVIGAKYSYAKGTHKICVGKPYDGTYFGLDDYLRDSDDNPDPEAASELLRFAPPWSRQSILDFELDLNKQTPDYEDTYFDSEYLQKYSGPASILEDTQGNEYFFDYYGLRYKDKKTVLYRRVGDGLRGIGDPCAPQSLKVSVTNAPYVGVDEEGQLYLGGYDPQLEYYVPGYLDVDTGDFVPGSDGDGRFVPDYLGRSLDDLLSNDLLPRSEIEESGVPVGYWNGDTGALELGKWDRDTGTFLRGTWNRESGEFVPTHAKGGIDIQSAMQALIYQYESRYFEYFDDLSSTGLSWISPLTDDSPGTTKKINAYFGRDGRLIPVCDAQNPEISPCLDKSDAYYDPGLDAAVWWTFLAGLAILLGSIVSRLIFGWIANRFDPPEPRDSNAEGGEPTASGPPGDLAAAQPEDLLNSRP